MTGARVALLLFSAEKEVWRKAQRVTVVGCDIEVLRHVVMIELGKEAHEVVQHVASGRVLANQLHLNAVECHHFIRGKPAVVQAVCGVGLGHCTYGRVYFFKAAVFLAPKHGTPGVIERIDADITCFQSEAKCLAGRFAVALHRQVATVLVVGLPSDNRRVLAIAAGHLDGDACRLCPV